MNVPIIVTAGRLPLNLEVPPYALFQAIRNRMKGYLRGDSLLTGDAVSTSRPLSDIGPYFNGASWEFWDPASSSYAPEVHKLDGQTPNVAVTFASNPTAARLVYLQDKSGTMLFVNDIYVPRALVILLKAPYVIDWGRSNDFMCLLHENTAFTMVGSKEGQEISVATRNDGTAFTVSWPSFVVWPAGIQPSMVPSQAGQSHLVEWKFININGVIYGEQCATVSQANPSNTVFIGGTDTSSGKEQNLGFHSNPSSNINNPIP